MDQDELPMLVEDVPGLYKSCYDGEPHKIVIVFAEEGEWITAICRACFAVRRLPADGSLFPDIHLDDMDPADIVAGLNDMTTEAINARLNGSKS